MMFWCFDERIKMRDRYLRNAQALSEADQGLLASKRALVVGCGGLGVMQSN